MLPFAGFAGVSVLGILAFSWVTARRRRREDGVEKDVHLAMLDVAETEHSTSSPSARIPAEEAAASEVEVDQEPLSETPLILGKEDDEDPESPLSLMSSLSDFDAETDEADVLSEADIYIAYGRHGEAQELLLKEMKRYPGRLDIKFKLAEAYAGARDIPGLKEMMRSIESAGGDRTQPGQWKRLQDLAGRIQPHGDDGAGTKAPMVDIEATPQGDGRESERFDDRFIRFWWK